MNEIISVFSRKLAMTIIKFISIILCVTLAFASKPNILWIISEDNGLYLGCYGDKNADTPNLDDLAQKGIRYTNCFANAPVCAPARSTLLLGIHASSAGTHHMRSNYAVPKTLVPYPTLLKEAGYYTTNAKSDFNTKTYSNKLFDASSTRMPTYFDREDKSQPFFGVHNLMDSHESRIFITHPKREIKHPGAGKNLTSPLSIPDYQVDNQQTRTDWARVYSTIEKADAKVGKILADLEKSGEAENTIVIYCSDHGGIMIRSKRYLFDSGTRVPLIVSFPEKWKHLAPAGYEPGMVSERLIDFTDITKTLLNLTGTKVPDYYAGRNFAGENQEQAKKHLLLFSGRFDEAIDHSRALADGRYKYFRNYEPDRKLNQLEMYPLNQEAQIAQWKAYKAGETNAAQSAVYANQPAEAFFDTSSDPHEVNNLISSKEHQELIEHFRKGLTSQLIKTHDLGFIPEPLMAMINETSTVYEWAQSNENYPLQDIIKIANLAGEQNPENLDELSAKLIDSNPVIRYWAAVGLRVLGEKAAPVKEKLKKALQDDDASVRITVACALGKIEEYDLAVNTLIAEAKKATTDAHANWALNGLKYIEFTEIPENAKREDFVRGQYSGQAFKDLLSGKTYTQRSN